MTKKVLAKVFRYNPTVDARPKYKTYEVPWREYLTVLEVLRYIHDNIEPISFDYGCRCARCGSCGVQIDKKPVLACLTVVRPGEILIEPLANFPVIKDLVVDRTEVEAKLPFIQPWLARSKPITELMNLPYKTYKKVTIMQLCIDCLLCHSSCSVIKKKGFDSFCGPSLLIKIAMRYYDPRDELKEKRLETAVHEGLFECIQCGNCTTICPQPDHQLDPASIIREMQEEARKTMLQMEKLHKR